MNKLLAALAVLLLAAPSAFAAQTGFGPGETLDARAVVADAKASIAASDLEAFVRGLGEATYAGTTGTLTRDGEAFTLVETRIISQQKTLNGHPGATLRLYRRAAKDALPSHVEGLGCDFSLEVSGDRLLVERDGKPDTEARLEKAPTPSSIVLTYRKTVLRYQPDVVEALALSLREGGLCVERSELVSGVVKTRESFCAPRR